MRKLLLVALAVGGVLYAMHDYVRGSGPKPSISGNGLLATGLDQIQGDGRPVLARDGMGSPLSILGEATEPTVNVNVMV